MRHGIHGFVDECNHMVSVSFLALAGDEGVVQAFPLGHIMRNVWYVAFRQCMTDFGSGHSCFSIGEDPADRFNVFGSKWTDCLHNLIDITYSSAGAVFCDPLKEMVGHF